MKNEIVVGMLAAIVAVGCSGEPVGFTQQPTADAGRDVEHDVMAEMYREAGNPREAASLPEASTLTPDVNTVSTTSDANACSPGYVTNPSSPTQCGYWWGWRGCCTANPTLPDDPCASCTVGASNGCQGGTASYLLCPTACASPHTGCNVAAVLGLETDYCCR